MRKWVLLFILAFEVFGAIWVHADTKIDPIIWLSSATATNETAARIACSTVVGGGGCRFHGVVVSSAGVASSIIIYNSSSTAVNPIATIDTNASSMQGNSYFYDLYLSSGLVYTTAGTTPAKVNILYAKPTIR